MKTWEEAVRWLVENPEKREFVKQCYYDEPIGESSERFMSSLEWKGILNLLGRVEGKRVLEIGAGRGLVSYAFSKSGAIVTALEPDKSELVGTGAIRRLIQQTGVEIDIAEEFGESLPFSNAEFDIVFCRCVLHHAYDLPKMCAEISRVLRTSGVFLADREHVISGPSQLSEFLEKHPLHFLYGGENAYELNVYKSAIVGSGNFRKLKVLASHDHEVNLLPHNSPEIIKEMAQNALRKIFFPNGAAKWLASTRLVYKLYCRSLSIRDKSAGRFYSFLAEK